MILAFKKVVKLIPKYSKIPKIEEIQKKRRKIRLGTKK